MRHRFRSSVLLVLTALTSGSCRELPFGGCTVETPAALATLADSFTVAFETSRGRFDVVAHKDWAPIAAARFRELVDAKFFDDARFFRTVQGFVAQFGIPAHPATTAAWRRRCIDDEPVKHTNARGTLAYGEAGPRTRSVQLFINLADNPKLDSLGSIGFPPFAQVTSGMDVVDSLYSGYGEAAPRSGSQYGREGPMQDSIMQQGNAYLVRGWPKLDYIKTARVVQAWRNGAAVAPTP